MVIYIVRTKPCNLFKDHANSDCVMSTGTNRISTRLQELINQANSRFPSTGESIMAAYNQALEEGYTPREAKNMLYDNVIFLNERTIRRYLPIEARDIEKIRKKNHTADNDSQKSAEKDPSLNCQLSDQREIIADTSHNEEIANHDSSHKNVLSSVMIIMKLENILKNKDKYIIDLLERNERLNTENCKLKEEKQAYIESQNSLHKTSEGVLKVKVEVRTLYRDLLLVRNIDASQAVIHISNGTYTKLEPV
jgi:hypothetical protein